MNLRIGEQKEVSYLCKTEIKDLVKIGKVLNGGPEGTLLEPAPIVAKLLVERKYGRIFRLPTIRASDAPELNDEFEYIL